MQTDIGNKHQRMLIIWPRVSNWPGLQHVPIRQSWTRAWKIIAIFSLLPLVQTRCSIWVNSWPRSIWQLSYAAGKTSSTSWILPFSNHWSRCKTPSWSRSFGLLWSRKNECYAHLSVDYDFHASKSLWCLLQRFSCTQRELGVGHFGTYTSPPCCRHGWKQFLG